MKRVLPLLMLAVTSLSANLHAETASVPTVPVSVTRVSTQPLEINISAPGELESPADPIIAAEVEGQVISVVVRDGESVEAGQLLATLDPEPHQIAVDSAKANIARIEAVITNQQLTVTRLQELIRKHSSAHSELDKAQADLAASRAELRAAKANLRNAVYRLGKTRIQSPVKGVIQQRAISVGSYVRSGDTLFQVVATDSLSARLSIPEALLNRVKVGQNVELRAGGENGVVQATLTRLLPALDPSNRSLAAMVDFDNQYHWRPGSSVSARITIDRRDKALMIPIRSVVRRPAGNVVYRIDKGTALQQPVVVGERKGEALEVREGLSAGTTIALDGAGFLTDGARVEIRESKP